MRRRLFVRCLVAAVGALTVFTTAVATPATCRLEVHGRPLIDHACSAEFRGDGRTIFEGRDGRGVFVTLSVLPVRKDAATARLRVETGSDLAQNTLGELRRDGHCWSNAAVKACVIPARRSSPMS